MELTLDVGCGATPLGDVNVDAFPEDREQCGEEYDPKTIKNFILADAHHLPLRSHLFSKVYCMETLEHLTDPLSALREMRRVCKGKVIVKTPSEYNTDETKTHIYTWNRVTLHHLLERVFDCVESGYIRVPVLYGNRGGRIISMVLSKFNIYRSLYAIGYVRKPLRILHVWCVAGVGGLIAREQRRMGHHVDVIKLEGYDGLDQDQYYDVHYTEVYSHVRSARKFKWYSILPLKLRQAVRGFLRKFRSLKFYLTARYYARNYDIIHLHSHYQAWFFLLGKPKIIEFHGDDVRRQPTMKRRTYHILLRLFLWVFHFGTTFYVSTPDLLDEVPNSRWIPNPVDTEMFHSSNPRPRNGKALYVLNWYETSEWAKEVAEKNGWELIVWDRTKHEYVLYYDMPFYLAQFEYFIDRHAIESLSKTALEALALGLKVVRWDGKIIKGLPNYHRSENVARRCLQIYEKILK